MRRITIIFIIFLGLSLTAQNDSARKHRNFDKRFGELEKVKLLEILELDEETAVKFFTRKKQSQEQFKKHLDESKIIYDDLEKAIDDGSDKIKLNSLIQKIMEKDALMMKDKNKFIKSLDDILTPEQIAKVVLFDRKFKKDIRDLLLEHGRKKYFKDKKGE
jgi:glutaredoxin 2